MRDNAQPDYAIPRPEAAPNDRPRIRVLPRPRVT